MLKVSSLISTLILLLSRAAAAKRSLSHLSVCLTEHGRCTMESLTPEKERAALAKQSRSFCPQHFVSLCLHLPLCSLPWCIIKQILEDWGALNLATQPHQGQLENCFQNPQLGHFTLIGWTGSWKEAERTNEGVSEVLSPWVDSGRSDGFERKEYEYCEFLRLEKK